MVLEIALVSLAIILSLVLAIYSWRIAKIHPHRIESEIVLQDQRLPTDQTLPQEELKIGQPAVRSAPPMPQEESRVGRSTVRSAPTMPNVRASESKLKEPLLLQSEDKIYKVNRKVLISYVKKCPIKRPVQLLVTLAPDVKKLVEDAIRRSHELLPSETEPELIKESLSFESEKPNPRIQVALSFPEGTVKADVTKITKRLDPNQNTEFLFLVMPLVGTTLKIFVRIDLVESDKEAIELMAIPVTISAKAFWIFGDQQLAAIQRTAIVSIIIACMITGILLPDSRVASIIMGGIGLIAGVFEYSLSLKSNLSFAK